MNRKLALMLAVAVILMVNVIAGEGGALDGFSGGRTQVAEADVVVEGATPPARMAVATTPASSPWGDGSGSDSAWTDEIGMYGDPEPVTEPERPTARDAAPPPAPAREHTPRIGNRGDVGAIDRSRMNIEE